MNLKGLVHPLFRARTLATLKKFNGDSCAPEAFPHPRQFGRHGPNTHAGNDLTSAAGQVIQIVELDSDVVLETRAISPVCHELRRDENVRVIPEDVDPIRHFGSPPDAPRTC